VESGTTNERPATYGSGGRRADLRAVFPGDGELATRCRSLDWAATRLGPAEQWPASLRTAAAMVVAAGCPMVLLWGRDLVQVYNDGCRALMGAKHPTGLGQPNRECWPEVWDLSAPVYEQVLAGNTVRLEDALFPIARDGAGPTDAWFTLAYSPVPNDDGGVGGILVVVAETTEHVVGRAAQAERERLERRLNGALLDSALVLDQMNDAYLVMDSALRIVAVNPSAERALGTTRGALLGRSHGEAFPGSVGAEPERQYRRVAAERVPAHFVHHYVGDGYDFHLEVDAYPSRGDGVAVFWRDVSERVRLLADAQAARADAEDRAATLAAVIASIPDAVLVAHAETVTLANQSALDQFGVATPSAGVAAAAGAPRGLDGVRLDVRQLDGALLDPATGAPLPLARTPIGRAFAGERSHAHVLLRALGSAAARSVRAAAAPIVGPGGVILGAVAVLTDITAVQRAAAERERLVHALEVERARLAYVFQEAPTFLAILRGPDHVFEVANAVYYQLVGHRDLVGKPIDEALPEVREQGFVALLDRVLETGEPFVGREVPIRLARTPGAAPEARFVDFVYLPLVEADGTRAGVIAHGTDVTEQVEARREIERLLRESERARADAEAARADAEAANRSKGEFLTVMSHELRTPLNAIGGYAELLELGLRGPVTETQRADLARIKKSQRHLLGLINGVLTFARLDAGAVHYELDDVALAEVLAACEALIVPQARSKRITLDAGQCRRRALRARRPGEAAAGRAQPALQRGEVHRGGRPRHARLRPRVRGGCPRRRRAGRRGRPRHRHRARHPLDQLERVFQPFVQVDAGLTRTHDGTGLGLAISRDLARGMGGDVTVESALGVGSVFTVTLPSARSAAPSSPSGPAPSGDLRPRGARA
jgi:PAS domain S-box-containing protein